jgi:hypothetical protein
MDENGEGAMEQALDRDQAAETIRTVEGMRRRTIAAVNRLSPIPLLIFGLAALAAVPLTFLNGKPRVIGSPGENVIVVGGEPLHEGVVPMIVVSLATLVAVVLTELHYRRQPVHPAPPPRKATSPGEAIFLAIVLIVFGPGIIASLFVFAPFSSGSNILPFVAFCLAGLVMAKRVHNGALGLASVWAFVFAGLSPLIWADHWEAVAAGGFAALFLLSSLAVRYLKRRPV